jgi:hypothetical protein
VTASIAAPTGGINRVDPAGGLPKTDCIHLFNMLPAEYGCRSRLGSREHCTGLDGPVRSELPFSGSQQSGSGDRKFSTTQTGIWDTSASSAAPTRVVDFPSSAGEAGYGVSCVVANTVGQRFLLYTDEENGLYYYSESSTTWTKVAGGTAVLWAPSTTYLVGEQVVNGDNVYECVSDGESAISGGPTGTGAGISDGSTSWNYVSASATGVIGPSLADQRNGFSLDPGNFVFVGVWKSFVMLVEKDTSAIWYGEAGSFLGTFTRFDFGLKMPHGGPLVGIYNWSYDAGSGMETYLVALSTAGDVVIYHGTDPTTADTFGLKGCWFLGGVPAGRSFVTDYGGDILVISTLGIVPLSKLITGKATEDQSIYTTYKVQPLFNLLVSTFKTLRGWALHVHPTDNALLVLVPTSTAAPILLAMSFATGGWGQYRDLPMACAGVWNGQLYFGTADGRVLVNEGYVDEVKLDDTDSFTPVNWSVLTGYRSLGNARQKRVHMVRPNVLSDTPDASVEAEPLFGLDLSELSTITGSTANAAGTWDESNWDDAVFAGDYTPSQPLQGADGMGREVAIAVRGAAKSRTILTSIDVWFDQGGIL